MSTMVNHEQYVALLRACAKQKDLHKGSKVHVDILHERLLAESPRIASSLVNMYAKCGALRTAQQVHDELPIRDVVTWSALIAGYAQHGHGKQALKCFEQMQHEGLYPDAATFTCILKACGSMGAAHKGKQIHDEIDRRGLLGTNIILGTALVDMYAKCGLLRKAKQVLEELPTRNVVSWSALIAGYAQHGHDEEALNCFEQMQHEGICPNMFTFGCILKACGSAGAVDKGKQIHDEIVRQGLLGKDIVLCNALVDMYAKCGVLPKAHELLDALPVRNVVTWSALIAGYSQHGHGEEALNCFEQMQNEGICPNAVTFTSVLKACGTLRAADKGKQIHDQIVRQGLLGTDIVLDTALVDMYAKCGALVEAQEVHNVLLIRDVVSWSALINGYVQHGHANEALNCLGQMQREGLCPNAVTLTCILQACGSIGAAEKGREIHDNIIRQGLLGTNILLDTALVDMHVKCGALAKAQEVLDKLPVRNVVSWNALITGYAQHGHGKEALNCFNQMQHDGLCPDAVTFACILKACGSIGAVEKGKQIHDEIVRQGLLGTSVVLDTALVDMYVKCGALAKAKAHQVLDKLPGRSVASWNALIAGYAEHGNGEEALNCFKSMQHEGLCPDAVTVLCVLSACSHSGLLGQAHTHFREISSNCGIIPTLEHHTCMVDLFGRAGHFDKAIEVIKKMPFPDCSPVWSVLLAACQKWGNMTLGKLVFQNAVQQDKINAAVSVNMNNIYAAAGMQEDVVVKMEA